MLAFYCVAVAIPDRPSRPTVPLPAVAAEDIPETRRYRLKNRLLGPPLVTEQLATERLSRPIALGVLAPDCISSSAYGTEEMLTQLVPYVGLAAFTLVVPITLAILGVLFFVTLSYLEVIAALHEGRRLLRRGPRQLRPEDRPDRRRGAADRLHGDRRRADVGRHGGADQRRARAWPTRPTPWPSPSASCSPPLRQPARHPRGRQLLRHPDLLLHLLAGLGDRRRLRQGGRWASCTTIPLPPATESTAGRSARRARAG